MRISISITDDPLEISLDIEHPSAEEAMGRAVELTKLLEDNILMHAPRLRLNQTRGFATPEMEAKP